MPVREGIHFFGAKCCVSNSHAAPWGSQGWGGRVWGYHGWGGVGWGGMGGEGAGLLLLQRLL